MPTIELILGIVLGVIGIIGTWIGLAAIFG